MNRLSIAMRARNWLMGEIKEGKPVEKAGIRLNQVVCDTQTHPMAWQGKPDGDVEQRQVSGGAVTLRFHTDDHELDDKQITALADLIHAHPTGMHQQTQTDLKALFSRTVGKRGERRQVRRTMRPYAPVDVHAVISESNGRLYHRIRLTRRKQGLDIEIRTWKPEGFDLTGTRKTSVNPTAIKSGFVRGLQQLENDFKTLGIPIQWPKQKRPEGFQSVSPIKN